MKSPQNMKEAASLAFRPPTRIVLEDEAAKPRVSVLYDDPC
jgi:hypothetical protein